MKTKPATVPLIVTLTNNLVWIERIALAGLAIGIVLALIKISTLLQNTSLGLLAATYFFYAYKPVDIPVKEDEQLGFIDLLALLIAPKVQWISTAITTLGVLFFFLELANESYKNILFIGVSTSGMSLLLIAFARISGVRHIGIVTPLLMRSLPVLILGVYTLLR